MHTHIFPNIPFMSSHSLPLTIQGNTIQNFSSHILYCLFLIQ